jgi:predicted site-specific integrase-resolvase
MRRSYHRRSADERVADLDKKIAALKAKQSAREKKDDPVLREIQKLLKRLKRFIQYAHDHKRPDVANSVMGFKSMLERILATELGAPAAQITEVDDEEEE